MIQDSDLYWTLVDTVMNVPVPCKRESLSFNSAIIGIPRRSLLRRVKFVWVWNISVTLRDKHRLRKTFVPKREEVR